MARGSAIFFEGRKGDYIMGGATEFANFMNPADTVGYFLTKHLEKCMNIRDFQLLIENMNKIYFLKNEVPVGIHRLRRLAEKEYSIRADILNRFLGQSWISDYTYIKNCTDITVKLKVGRKLLMIQPNSIAILNYERLYSIT